MEGCKWTILAVFWFGVFTGYLYAGLVMGVFSGGKKNEKEHEGTDGQAAG